MADWMLIIMLLNAAFIISAMYAERYNPKMLVLWAVLMALFPVVGFLLYLLFGQTFYSRKAFRRKRDYDAKERAEQEDFKATLPSAEANRVADALRRSGGGACVGGNKVRYISESEDFFDSLFDSLAHAQRSILAEYYIIRRDATGRRMLEILIDRAKAGVSVRLLVDEIGTRNLPPELVKKLRKSGGKVDTFHRTITLLLSAKKNNRNHRKIAVIDGNTAFVSGFNVGDEYLGKGKFGHWRDAAVVIEGPAADYYTRTVLQDWRYAHKEDLVRDASLYGGRETGDVPVQLTAGGPDMSGTNSVHMQYVSIADACRERIWIETPYLGPTEPLLYLLRLRALQGADVRIIIPDIGDHAFVYWGNRFSASRLMDAGVRIYEYHDGFIHAKTVVGDGYYCSVGSANMDPRSMNLNFECNAMVYSEEIAKDMEEAFEKDLESCTEYTMQMYAKRTLLQRFKTFLSRFLADLL
jgi:cardiolipin synthase